MCERLKEVLSENRGYQFVLTFTESCGLNWVALIKDLIKSIAQARYIFCSVSRVRGMIHKLR